MLVDSLLSASARRRPDSTALVCGSRRLTYGELEAQVARVAAHLARLGVARGDRVAIYLENSVEAVVSVFGALRAGAVFVPINPGTKADKLGYVLRDCAPRVLVADARAAQVIAEALTRVPDRPVVVQTQLTMGAAPAAAAPIEEAVPFEELLTAPVDVQSSKAIDVDLAALIYTSGSTGRPKGVMLTHANIVAATTSINGYLQNSERDVILDVLPLSFDYGLYQLFLAFQVGASVVLERSFAYPTLLFDLIEREGVTGLPIVPMIAAMLLRYDVRDAKLSSLRYITNTGAVLPPPHIAAIRQSLPHVRVFSMYGLTECKRVSYLDPDEIDRRPSSVGKAMGNVEVFLLDGNSRRLDRGVGELVVRGANVMQGYWQAPAESNRVLRPGSIPGERLLHTGDIFRIDDEGFLYFLHRLDDVIKSRGQKVSPREVEDVLHGAPGVTEALVIGVRDELLGEAVKGFVTLAPGSSTTEQAILAHCAAHLEDFMVPREIEIVATLPHNGSGKLSRREVQAIAAQP